MKSFALGAALSVFTLAVTLPTPSEAQAPVLYGAPIGIETAKKVAAAAIAEAKKNGWTVAAAIVDPAGVLVYFERIDGTQNGSSHVAPEKARSAALFKRPTKAFEDAVAGGRVNVLALPGAIPLEGGIPLMAEGKIIGAIGVSGMTSQQDGVCAKAGVDVLAAGSPPPK